MSAVMYMTGAAYCDTKFVNTTTDGLLAKSSDPGTVSAVSDVGASSIVFVIMSGMVVHTLFE